MKLFKIFIIVILTLNLEVSFASDRKINRRGFLKFIGGGAASTVAISNGALDTLSSVFEGGDFDLAELLDHTRRALLEEGLLDPANEVPIQDMNNKVRVYEKLLRAVEQRPDLNEAQRKIVREMLDEFRSVYYKFPATEVPKKPKKRDLSEE